VKLAAAAAAAGALVLAGTGAAETKPTGNAKGLALLAKVEHAYLTVPAVRLSGRTNNVDASFVIVLRRGVGIAESFAALAPQGSERLVTQGGSTYELRVGTTCWRKLAKNSRSALEDVGARFPLSYRTRVGVPKRTASGWQLPVHMEGKLKGEGGNALLVIDGRTFRVRSNFAPGPNGGTVEHVTALERRPALPQPTPLC
jgi:hypothetical protein